jgi:uncharacterized lipoprotein YddW (UPF0748 family)
MHQRSDGAKPARRHRFLLRFLAITLMAGASAGVWIGFDGPSLGDRTLPGAVADPGTARDDEAASRGGVRLSSACPGQRLLATRELRAFWLTTVRNLDWPSKPGLSPDQVKAEYRAWLDVAVRMNHNAVFVHVRPSGDAFWPSTYAPWSYWLTGSKSGASPGWDPMEFMVAEAHARNLEFHAWFNPYKASQFGTLAELPASHKLRQHPRWAVAYPSSGSGRRLYFDPGIPAARQHVEDAILDAVTRYDIDGVHFDDFFYPYPENGEDFDDKYSYTKYGAGMAKADWRRQNVNLFVKEMHDRIKAAKPWIKYGISPFAIWRNKASNAAGSATDGLESYSAIYADTRRWVREGWLDYIVPQVYWHIGNAVANYAVLIPWWANLVKGTRVQLYIGQADYRVGEAGPWKDPAQLDKQLALNEKYGVNGSVHFSARHVRDDLLGAVSRYRKAHYATPALIPAMGEAEAEGPAPGRPTELRVRPEGAGTVVTWHPPGGPKPTWYAVYRTDAADQPAKLVATLRGTGDGEQTWTDPTPQSAHSYCVTALDRLWNESP